MELKTRVRAVAPDLSNFVCENMIFRQGIHPNIPHMANIFSSGHLLVVVPFFWFQYIPFCNRMRYPDRNIPHRLSRTQYHAENITCAMKLSLKAAETAMKFIRSRSWLSDRVAPLFCVADAQFTDQPSCHTPQYTEIKSEHIEK